MTEANQQANEQAQQSLTLIRVYLKDVSFEAPNLPELFQQNFEPKYSISLTSKARVIEGNIHEVVLTVNVECKIGETVAFICEAHQGGLFEIAGLEGFNLRHAVSSYAPNILFPYARATIAGLIGQGGFPALHLNPVNFDALLAMQLQKEAEQAKANGVEAATVQ